MTHRVVVVVVVAVVVVVVIGCGVVGSAVNIKCICEWEFLQTRPFADKRHHSMTDKTCIYMNGVHRPPAAWVSYDVLTAQLT